MTRNTSDCSDTWDNEFLSWANKHQIKPKKVDLYRKALTHASYYAELNIQVNKKYETLEFLGDAVLNLVIADYIYRQKPDAKPGDLTLIRGCLVNTETLSSVTKEIGLDRLIVMGSHLEKDGGRQRNSILEDAFEAFIGALFVDRGWRETVKFIRHIFKSRFSKFDYSHLPKDPKSELQETCQRLGIPNPVYQIESETGPDHNKTFKVGLYINNEKVSTGEGSSKKSAEMHAARLALPYLRKKRLESDSKR